MNPVNIGFYFIVALVVVDAILVDLKRHEIPDRSSLVFLGLAALRLALEPSWLLAASMLTAVMISAAIALLLYRFALWGGGDVKLSVAMSLWIGLPGLDLFWFGVAAVGFVALALAKYRNKREVAFAPALAAGLCCSQVAQVIIN